MRIRTAVAAVVVLVAGSAVAGDDWKAKLEAARTEARASENLKAAALYGEALAAVQKAGDLVGEQEAATAFFEFLERLPEPPRRGGQEVSSTVAGLREVTAAAMARLDAGRCGALVSAPCLAGDLLFEAIQRGDGRFVAEAAAALEPHGKGTKSGAGLKVLAMLARGAKEAAAGDEKAAGTIADARDAAVRQEWTDLGMAAGVELAALHAKKGDAAKAREAVEALAKLVTPKTEGRFVHWCRDAVEARLKDAPTEVRKPFEEALAAASGPSSVSARGGRGGAGGAGGAGGSGGSGGEEPSSPLGAALRKVPKGKPLATASRTENGFEFRVSWDPKFRGVHERQDGVKHLDEGGLTLGFADWSVGVVMVDPIGTRGQPGESSHLRPGRAYYRLAPGETFALLKEGAVQVSAK